MNTKVLQHLESVTDVLCSTTIDLEKRELALSAPVPLWMESGPKPVNVLCLDGGGVRGLSALLILDNLLQQVKRTSDLSSDPLPCEVFDVICGTSTGGLIALMLGRLRMNIKDATECYLKFSETIFGEKVWFPYWKKLRGKAVYSAATLEKCVRDIVAEHVTDTEDADRGDAPLVDPSHDSDQFCRTFVVAVSRSFTDAPPKLFRTYSTTEHSADDCKIWEAARATTAASTFFDPMTMGEPPQTYIDGALGGANNPCELALEEIEKIFPGRPIGCFLSLGTGVPNIVTMKGSLAHIARSCARLLTNCESVQERVVKEFNKQTPESGANPYFRFSVDRGLGDITLDEWRRKEELSSITQGYMRYTEQEARAQKCVKALQRRAEEINDAQNVDSIV